MTKRPRTTVIWLNYNSIGNWKLTEASLLSINGSGSEPQVLVVDNASTDGSYERLHDLVSKGIVKRAEIIRNPANLGYAGGNNVGYQHLTPSVEYFALMNNDFVLARGALEKLLRILDANPDIGAIQGKLVSLDGKFANYGFMLNEILESTPIRHKVAEREVSYTTGSFSVYRVDSTRQVEQGGLLFIPRLFIYGDDDFLGLKLWKTGYKCICAENVMTGQHSVLGSFEEQRGLQFYLSSRAWLALLTASNSKYRMFELLTAWRLAFIGMMRAFLNGDPRELVFGIRAWVDGIRLGRWILRQRGTIDIYAAPLQATSLLQVIFARFFQQTISLIQRRSHKYD